MKIITLANSIDWTKLYKLADDAGGVQSTITTNKYGAKFFVLYGNTFPIKDKLGELGFKFFKGTWSKKVEFIDDATKNALRDLKVDLSPLDLAPEPAPAIGQPQEKTDIAAPQAEPQTPVEQELQKMKAGVEMAMKEPTNERVRGLLSFVDRMIERVAQMTDEASQSEFIKSFMQFAAKFHGYSFGNQILIWVQNPKATYVKGFKQWMELGRQVKNWDKPITIIVPMPRKITPTAEEAAGKTPEEIAGMTKKVMRFGGGSVYDIADTEPIPGWEKMKGTKPFEPVQWRKDPNEAKEEITTMVNSLKEWAAASNITVNFEEMAAEMGGFSAGGKIAINNTFEGINLFSTMVHECAHEILHWEESKMKGVARDIRESRQEKEIDAETTAFIVLQHYGFETKDTPNYLALWKAKGEDVKKRREHISRAVKTIIEGIDKSMKGLNIEETAANKTIRLIISKSQWTEVGKKSGWMK